MTQTLDELTGHVHKAIRELQAACPDQGFIVIGMLKVDGHHTGISMACNVDEDAVKGTLVSIIEDRGEDIYPVAASKMVN